MTTSDPEPTSQASPQPLDSEPPRINTNVYVLLAIIFGIFTYLSFTPPVDKLQWPTTQGMVTGISYSEKNADNPIVNYEYTVKDQKYTRSEPLAAWLTTTIVDGHPLIVIYHPTNPSNAEFLPGINPATYLLGSVSLVLLVMSFIAVMKTMSPEVPVTTDGDAATMQNSTGSKT